MAHPHGCGRSMCNREEGECRVKTIIMRLGSFVQEITRVDNRMVRLQAWGKLIVKLSFNKRVDGIYVSWVNEE